MTKNQTNLTIISMVIMAMVGACTAGVQETPSDPIATSSSSPQVSPVQPTPQPSTEKKAVAPAPKTVVTPKAVVPTPQQIPAQKTTQPTPKPTDEKKVVESKPATKPVATEKAAPSLSPSPAQKSNLPACVNSDCDCKDFATQAEAQRVLDAYSGDPHRLDRDKDGIACESN